MIGCIDLVPFGIVQTFCIYLLNFKGMIASVFSLWWQVLLKPITQGYDFSIKG